MTVLNHTNSFESIKGYVDHKHNKQRGKLDSREYQTNVGQLLKKFSNLSPQAEESITKYIMENGEKLISKALQKENGIHVCRHKSKLPVALNIDENGTIFIPLEKILGQGMFRVAKLSLALESQPTVVVSSYQKLKLKNQEQLSDREINILEKIAKFVQSHPKIEGLLKYCSSIKYSNKPKKLDPTEQRRLDRLFEMSGYASSSCYVDHVVSTKSKETENKDHLKKPGKHITFTHFCNGGNLEDRIKLGDLSGEEMDLITRKLLRGLATLHSKDLQIFHSDLKFDNIFLTVDSKGQVIDAVIGDFGFACDLSNPADRYFKNGHSSCKAPELATKRPGEAIDEKMLACDVYSMGLLLKKFFNTNYPNSHVEHLITEMTSTDPKNRPRADQALNIYLEGFVASSA